VLLHYNDGRAINYVDDGKRKSNGSIFTGDPLHMRGGFVCADYKKFYM